MGTKRVGWARIKSLINENQNQLKIRNEQIIITGAALTLTAADSGATIAWAHGASAGHNITLPPAAVGLNYTVVLVAGEAHNHHIAAVGTDLIYGKAQVYGTLADKKAAQVVLKGSGVTHVRLHKTTVTLGGDAGDRIRLSCAEAGFWTCTADLVAVGTPALPIGVLVTP